MLKQIAHAPLRDRDVDLPFAVEKSPRPDDDFPGIRPFDAGNTLQGLTLAAARSAEKAEDATLMAKLHVEGKRPPAFMDIQFDHARCLLSRLRFSKRLTVSRTTALMARFTRTQMKALYSSLVRHS